VADILTMKSFAHGVEDRGWDWYCLADPPVTRRIVDEASTGGEIKLSQRFILPAPGTTLPNGWRRLNVPGYADVQWSHYDGPGLAVNGFIVDAKTPSGFGKRMTAPFDRKRAVNSNDGQPYQIEFPSVSIFDPDGRLPLNIQRTSLQTRLLPFHDSLVESVLDGLLYEMLQLAPTEPYSLAGPPRGTRLSGLELLNGSLRWAPFFTTPDGAGFFDTGLVSAAMRASLLILDLQKSRQDSPSLAYPGMLMFARAMVPHDNYAETVSDILSLFNAGRNQRTPPHRSPLSELNVIGIRMVVRPRPVLNLDSAPIPLLERVRRREIGDGWEEWAIGSCDGSQLGSSHIQAIVDRPSGKGLGDFGCAELLVGSAREPVNRSSQLAERLCGLLGGPLIPFDPAVRASLSELLRRRITSYVPVRR
jgi:hypothetical protein